MASDDLTPPFPVDQNPVQMPQQATMKDQSTPVTITLTIGQIEQISTILSRRANEIATYKEQQDVGMPASVAYACTLEITRLRSLSGAINPTDGGIDLHS